MPNQYIWDTGAVTLYFADNTAAKGFMKKIEHGKAKGYIPRIIFAEYYYITWQHFGKRIAQYRISLLKSSVNEEISLDEKDIFHLGKLKINETSLSFVDCAVLSIAKRIKATVLTTDKFLLNDKDTKAIKLDY